MNMIENKNLSSIIIDDTVYESQLNSKFINRKKYRPVDPKIISARIPGIIRSISVRNGQSVNQGDQLLTLEAMKMMNNLKSHLNAKIKKIYVKEGEMVAKGQILVEFE
jgi:Acetyl/propionyl-CoA carboxylase, alpha subunit